MKLLKREEVNTIKASERKLEIDEAVKLAKKVDYLRKTSSEEEASLAKAREKSLLLLRTDIENLTVEKRVLDIEVKALQEARMLAEAPIDLVEKWDKVKADELRVEDEKVDILNRETNIIAREAGVQATQKFLFVKEETLKENENLTNRLLSEAKDQYEIAEKVRNNAQYEQKKAQKELKSKENELKQKENDLGFQERDLEIEKENLVKEASDIALEKLHIASQQETLRQAWISIKKLQP